MKPTIYRSGWRGVGLVVQYPADDAAPEFYWTEDVLVGGSRLRARLHFLAAFLIDKYDGDKAGLSDK